MKKYFTVSWDKEREVMSVINIRGETDDWHLNIIVSFFQVIEYYFVLLYWFLRFSFHYTHSQFFLRHGFCV